MRRFPNELVLTEPETILNELVCRPCRQMIANAIGQPVTVVWVPSEEGVAAYYKEDRGYLN